MTNYRELAQSTGRIARAAGAEILRIYETDDFGVETKADDSPLTKADKAANDVIVAGLEALTFQAPIVSEESGSHDYATRRQFTRHWLVDPLDGTKEFIKRNGDFTVNIALIENGRPVLGVVFVPVTDELFYSVPEEGAYLEVGADAKAQRIFAADFTPQESRLRIVASASHLNQETKDFMDRFDQPEIVQRGSSLKILELARGTAHVYPRLAPTMEWDTAAAHAVLLAAGGKLVDDTTGKELRYNKEELRNPHFVAYGRVREELLKC